MRITAQLIDAISGYHKWSKRYDRKLENFFELQDDIMRDLLSEMQIQLIEGMCHYLKQESIDLNVTASFGIATYPQDAGNKKQLLMAADLCLFQSKKEGKNRISITKR